MAARKDGKQGHKADKLFRDALMVAVKRDGITEDGKPTKKLALIAEAVVEKAITGDVPAVKEIADRLDGKVVQAVAGPDGESPIEMIQRIIVSSTDTDG